MYPGAQQKNDASKHTSQNPQMPKIETPRSIPKSDTIWGVAPPGAPLVAQTGFGH